MASNILADYGVRELDGTFVFERPLTRQALFEIAGVLSEIDRGTPLTSPDQLIPYLTHQIGRLEREVFAVLFLDTHYRLIAFEVIFQGTIDRCEVHPREIIKLALKHNASKIILAHNHVSGLVHPSEDDIQITKRIIDVMSMVQVIVVDHLIITAKEAFSLRENGLL